MGSRTPLMQPADAEALRENLVRGHAGDVTSQIWVEAMLGTAGQGGDLVLAYHDELAASRAREQALREEVDLMRTKLSTWAANADERDAEEERDKAALREEVERLRDCLGDAFKSYCQDNPDPEHYPEPWAEVAQDLLGGDLAASIYLKALKALAREDGEG